MPNCLAYPIAAFGALNRLCGGQHSIRCTPGPEMRRQFGDAGVAAIVGIDIMADKIRDVVATSDDIPVILARITDFFPGYVAGIIRSIQKVWTRNLPRIDYPYVRFTAALLSRGRRCTAGRTGLPAVHRPRRG